MEVYDLTFNCVSVKCHDDRPILMVGLVFLADCDQTNMLVLLFG